MQVPLRLWRDEELLGMNSTIRCLRQMRTAATLDTLPLTLKFGNLVRRVMGGERIELRAPQVVLAEAEFLADSAADFFAHSLHKRPEAKEKYEQWRDHLSKVEKLHELYEPTTFAKTSQSEANLSLTGRLRCLSIDPEYFLNHELTENNFLGLRTIEDLGEVKTGVIAPLSGDYLVASTYSRYLALRGETFSTHAVALSPDLQKAVFPFDLSERLKEVEAVGIYLDTSETGQTGRSLHEKLSTELAGKKTVHAPNTERTEFKKSPVMEDFWRRYETAAQGSSQNS